MSQLSREALYALLEVAGDMGNDMADDHGMTEPGPYKATVRSILQKDGSDLDPDTVIRLVTNHANGSDRDSLWRLQQRPIG